VGPVETSAATICTGRSLVLYERVGGGCFRAAARVVMRRRDAGRDRCGHADAGSARAQMRTSMKLVCQASGRAAASWSAVR
jgi:hypothetical protein